MVILSYNFFNILISVVTEIMKITIKHLILNFSIFNNRLTGQHILLFIKLIGSCIYIDISVEAAREHERWFIKFEELKARQKEAITKWKNEKKNISVSNFNVACSNNVEKKFSGHNEENALKVRFN